MPCHFLNNARTTLKSPENNFLDNQNSQNDLPKCRSWVIFWLTILIVSVIYKDIPKWGAKNWLRKNGRFCIFFWWGMPIYFIFISWALCPSNAHLFFWDTYLWQAGEILTLFQLYTEEFFIPLRVTIEALGLRGPFDSRMFY